MKIRIMGLPTEIDQAVSVINDAQVFDVIEVSNPYPNRGDSRIVRVYIEAQLSERYAIFDPDTGIQVSGWMSRAEAYRWQPSIELAHEQREWQIRRYDWQTRSWIPVHAEAGQPDENR